MLKHPPQHYAAKYKQSFMNMAEAVAENSVAIRNKVGCVIYLNDHTLSLGWNGRESGSDEEACEYKEYMLVDDAIRNSAEYCGAQWPLGDEEGNYRLVTFEDTLHSEVNAISKITDPELLKGAILFTNLQPCINCSKLIVESGITHVYYKHKYRCDEGLFFLQKNGILVEQIE